MQTGYQMLVGTLLLIVAVVWVLITIRRLVQTLSQTQQALASHHQFLGMMAHEMLTPLQTITSSVELIELSGCLPTNDKTLQRLRRSAQQLEAQMKDTVEFARLNGGRLKVSPMLFQPDLMMRIIVAEYEEAARERGIKFHVHIDPEPCPRIIADPARMRQIISNLISNATKYASPGEVVCAVRVQNAPSQLTIAVMDEGPGFDSSLNIWEPFVRGSQTQTGSGLGLAVVKLLADLMLGSARVVTRLGEGSAFIVQIPVEVDAPTSHPAPLPAHPGRQSILVIDDNDDVRFSLQTMLLALGMTVDVADSMAQAKHMLATTKYDGILLDIHLQDGSGYRVAEHAREKGAPNQTTPIVALSAYHEPNMAGDALFAAKFEKPITVARLRSALKEFG